MTHPITEGSPTPLGVTLDGRGANVAVFSAHATAVELCLFDPSGTSELARVRLPARTGDVCHGHVGDIRPGQRYGLRAYGPYDPGQGHRFNPNKLLIDPYASALDRPFALHPTMFGYRLGDPLGDLSFDDRDSAPYMPKAIAAGPEASGPASRLSTPWSDTVVYELHLRGFTKTHPNVPAALRGTWAALGNPDVIAHLQGLGVSAVEIMPTAAWIDESRLNGCGLTNYWGYNPVTWMAPDARLAPGGWREIRTSVDALHAAGIEVILDVVLNHSGEGDALGPTLSFRGLDNAVYYRLMSDNKRAYVNDSGCGNVVALDRPPVVALAIDSLCRWATCGGVDGFRFDLAASMMRRDNGLDRRAPLIEAIAADPVLKRLKLIAEPWDLGLAGYRIGEFPDDWGEWNDHFRDAIRRYWRGDAGHIGQVATRMAGSSDLFGRRRPSSSINFVAAHDGFTLADLVSYARKHNEANGEDNRDGADANYSWNRGVEGPTGDVLVEAARRRDQRNLLATLLLARGTPMMPMGAEFAHSQGGNNNAYAQDNATAWLCWDKADQSILDFCRRAIALRKAHPALRRDAFLAGTAVDATQIPDVEWRAPDGRAMEPRDWNDAGRKTLVIVLYCPPSADGPVDRVAVVMHAGENSVRVTLPAAPANRCWRLCLDTAQDFTAEAAHHRGGDCIAVDGGCVVVFDEVDAPGATRKPSDLSPDLLDHLARAAGIAPDWFDLAGRQHVVPDATKLAVLRGFGLEADTNSRIRESLARLSQVLDRGPLPATLVVRTGEPIRLRLAISAGRDAAGGLMIKREGGATLAVPVRLDETARELRPGVDGQSTEYAYIDLPPQPAGRHFVMLADRPDVVCRLTVAPSRCYLPDEFAAGQRQFGLAAQVYSLRSRGDQGIGDFSTLASLAETAADAGAATVGLNPMHALFSRDRNRASPYHPSDRRFLDPIYLDVTALDRVAAGLLPQATLSAQARRISDLSAAPHVDYEGVWEVKRRALEESYAAFDDFRARHPQAPTAREFADFVRRGGATLQRFAAFELISDLRRGQTWRQWPADLGRCDDGAIAEVTRQHASRRDFHLFLQWLCERQFAEAATRAETRGLTLRFYRDLAVGAAPDGAEAWMGADQLLHGVWVGAPPDPLAEGGQNWHLPPPNPLAWQQTGYAAFRELIAANMRHAGALRIDHAMGLTRLFVIPDGGRGADGAYLSYPFDDLLGELALESVRARCIVVGEALGTVPLGFREALSAADVLSYRVLWFERNGGDFTPPSWYDGKAVACVSTHDLPTLRGWWDGDDIREKEALGLVPSAHAAGERSQRMNDKRALIDALRAQGLLDGVPDLDGPLNRDVAVAIHAFVGKASSLLAIAQTDDLAEAVTAVNLPGTDRERPNWRRKLPVRVDDPLSDRALAILAGLSAGRRTRASKT